MGNKQHLNWLLEGVESWNNRRRQHRFHPDLSDMNLHRAFREAGKIEIGGEIPLANVNLGQADLTRTGFGGANLQKASLLGSELVQAFMLGADLSNADFSYADLTDAYLEDATLRGANFHKTITQSTNFTSAEPWQANFYYPGNTSIQRRVMSNTITSIEELLSSIQTIKDAHDAVGSPVTELYFRGESRSSWRLSPSIVRERISLYEGDMLREITAKRPSDFSEIDGVFSQWVVARHHGLRTRFIDITRNPLVALFFACESNRGRALNDGALRVFAVPGSLIKPHNSDSVSVLANFAKLPNEEQRLLLGIREEEEELEARFESNPYRPGLARLEPYDVAMEHLFQMIQAEKPYFVNRIDVRDFYQVFVIEPQQLSERIRAQSAAFIGSAFHERFERNQILKWNRNIPVYSHYKLAISGQHKAKLLDQLDLVGITRQTLFPGLDATAESITTAMLRKRR